MTAFHDHLESLRKTLSLTPVEVSKRMGRSDSYYRKMLDQESVPRGENLKRLAEALETTIVDLASHGSDEEQAAVRVATVTPTRAAARELSDPVELPNVRDLPRDVPVYGTASGSILGGEDGAWQLGSDAVDYVRRPPGLATNLQAYALFVENLSMSPRFEPGDLIYVNPARPARPGDYVIIQVQNGENTEREAYIKKLLRRTEKGVVCEQYNPSATVTFTGQVLIHRVMTTSEIMSL